MIRSDSLRPKGGLAWLAFALFLASPAAQAEEQKGFLANIRHFSTLTSTVPANGDQNPYAIVVAPASAGKIQKDDVLITNFNDKNNLQALGTTIVDFNPATKRLSLFAAIPRHLPQCPGGIGLTTAMTMLKSGWVIVGSLPSRDGTTATKGQGCLVVLDAQGEVAGDDSGAAIFVSNTGIGVGAPGQDVVRQANVLRIELAIRDGKAPVVTKETVIAGGFGQQADKDVFIVGPTGLALGRNNVLYVSDAIGNRIASIADATTRSDSAGTGEEVTKDGLLRRPLAMTTAPNGNLLVTNGLNGQAVEIDPTTGKQLHALWIDPNRAQTPPGSGDLFGIAMTPAGDGFYFVKDEMNTLVVAR